jgi:hypothetical protein
VHAKEEAAARAHTVPDDLAAAVFAHRRHPVDRALSDQTTTDDHPPQRHSRFQEGRTDAEPNGPPTQQGPPAEGPSTFACDAPAPALDLLDHDPRHATGRRLHGGRSPGLRPTRFSTGVRRGATSKSASLGVC